MTGAVQSLWDETCSDLRPLCGQVDTKPRRILHCPATQHVRDLWAPYVDWAVQQFPHWVYGPFAVMPEHVEVPKLVLSRRAMPSVHNPPALTSAMQLPRLRLFTDGSCAHPQSTWGKLAAWAVVMDLTTCDEEILGLLHEWRRTGMLPPHFAVVAQGGVPGEQSINRAEACAILAARTGLSTGYGRSVDGQQLRNGRTSACSR